MNFLFPFGLAALVGSLLGGGISFLSAAWIARRWQQKRQAVLTTELRKRETLYNEFVVACADLLGEFQNAQVEDSDALVHVITTLNRIRLSASSAVLKAAEATVQDIMQHYGNHELLTAAEVGGFLRECALQGADPMAKFSRACRDELWELRPTVA